MLSNNTKSKSGVSNLVVWHNRYDWFENTIKTEKFEFQHSLSELFWGLYKIMKKIINFPQKIVGLWWKLCLKASVTFCESKEFL